MKPRRFAEILAYTPDSITVAVANLAPPQGVPGAGVSVFVCPVCCGKNQVGGIHIHAPGGGGCVPHCGCDSCRRRSSCRRLGEYSPEVQAIVAQLRPDWQFILCEVEDPSRAGSLPKRLQRRVMARKPQGLDGNL
jgi:hypothetical protein